MNKQNEFDLGRTARNQGIERVDSRTPQQWKDAVDVAIDELASSGKSFTAEDVREKVGLQPFEVSPNAWGARFMAARIGGVISVIGREPTTRREAHARGGGITVYIGRITNRSRLKAWNDVVKKQGTE